jgi:nitroimidazol reductase NimA-like FMN-containing flavoprotein (pyridoxamine 5'-phosphate oxidase superfamily)
MKPSFEHRAAKILKEITYMTLGTVSPSNEPLTTPVYTAYDEELNFYWGSPSTTHHSQNLKTNNKVSFVIFNSKATEEDAEGVYGIGTAEELVTKEDIAKSLTYTYGRGGDTPEPAEMFMGESPVRMWKLTTRQLWMNDADKFGNVWVDKRAQLDFEKVKALLFPN